MEQLNNMDMLILKALLLDKDQHKNPYSTFNELKYYFKDYLVYTNGAVTRRTIYRRLQNLSDKKLIFLKKVGNSNNIFLYNSKIPFIRGFVDNYLELMRIELNYEVDNNGKYV
jgi:hypothetical protein